MEKHVIIVDDNHLNIEVLTMLLAREGIGYTTLESPRFLEATLEETGKPDVIFLDLEMPNYNGFDIMRGLKDDNRFASIPVVAYTVHTSEIDVARQAGFDGFLGKPVDPRTFPSILSRIFNGESIWEIS
jgi:two-component system cell cycle response regulator DivK